MKIISTNDQLLAVLPNTVKTVTGEQNLLTKITSCIEQVESYAELYFVGTTLMNDLASRQNTDETKKLLTHYIANKAIAKAAASIDLVLTANGFGVVSNNNLVPASQQRVDRLIGTCESNADQWLLLFIEKVRSEQNWYNSKSYQYFAFTLFPTLKVVRELMPDSSKGLWEDYQELRYRIAAEEERIARDFISLEEMAIFREEMAKDNINAAHARVIALVQLAIKEMVRGKSRPYNELREAVNIMRNDSTNFAAWQTSSAKQNFEAHDFNNNKKNGGYFF